MADRALARSGRTTSRPSAWILIVWRYLRPRSRVLPISTDQGVPDARRRQRPGGARSWIQADARHPPAPTATVPTRSLLAVFFLRADIVIRGRSVADAAEILAHDSSAGALDGHVHVAFVEAPASFTTCLARDAGNGQRLPSRIVTCADCPPLAAGLPRCPSTACCAHCIQRSLTSWWVDSEIDKAFVKEPTILKDRGDRVRALIPLDLDGYLFRWQSGKASVIKERLAADFTGWQHDNTKFEEQFDRLARALRTDEGREIPPPPRL